ncbi:MAG: AAA family ATPase [Actinomycetota bacterium]|nr:AAA family ATPase [Actinomycetota bacterium]
MKVAITGKGGTGKTTIAGVLSRSLARRGAEVVAVDADPNPNLAVTLGMGLDAAAKIESVTNVLLHEKAEHSHDGGHEHDESESASDGAEELLARLGVTAPDRVRLIQTGIIERPAEGCLCCGSHRTSRRIFDELDASDRVVIADLEAGVIDLLWVWPKPEDTALVVTEPYIKSLEVARRALEVTRDFGVGQVFVVANRVSGRADVERVRKYLPGYEILEVPDDPSITRAAQTGLSPIDQAGDSPAVEAVAEIAGRLKNVPAAVPGGQGLST